MNAQPQGFTFRAFKNGQVEVRHNGVLAAVLRGPAADKFLNAVKAGDRDLQQLMARLTGNYKRGNERQAQGHSRNRR
jgi:hypothetical protein